MARKAARPASTNPGSKAQASKKTQRATATKRSQTQADPAAPSPKRTQTAPAASRNKAPTASKNKASAPPKKSQPAPDPEPRKSQAKRVQAEPWPSSDYSDTVEEVVTTVNPGPSKKAATPSRRGKCGPGSRGDSSHTEINDSNPNNSDYETEPAIFTQVIRLGTQIVEVEDESPARRLSSTKPSSPTGTPSPAQRVLVPVTPPVAAGRIATRMQFHHAPSTRIGTQVPKAKNLPHIDDLIRASTQGAPSASQPTSHLFAIDDDDEMVPIKRKYARTVNGTGAPVKRQRTLGY